MTKLTLVVMALFATACSTTGAYRSIASGQIGCPENEVEVSNVDQGLFNTSYEATCRGKKFYCTSSRGSGTTVTQNNCKEEVK